MKSPWLLRALALAGLVISLYLFIQKATGEINSIKGCGAGSGCANVLGSRWSQFFGVPVSALAAAVYFGLLVVTFVPARALYMAFAICLTGAALWFFGLLYFEIKAFCPWCTATHLIGITCSVLLIISLRHLKRPEKKEETPVHFAPLAAVAGLLVLVLGQIFGPIPDTHLATTGGSMEGEDKEKAVHARTNGTDQAGPKDTPGEDGGRVVAVFDDKKFYNTATLPHIGPANAPHVIVKYFDYTCSSCLDMHKDLHFVNEQHPGKFCMIMLPVPLSRQCNPHFPKPLADHQYACELGRLTLAAWRAKPEAWPQVHEQLFTRPILTPEIAEIAVAQIVGEEALAKAMSDPWIEELLKANNNDFRQLIEKTRAMPKLLVGKGRMLHGVTKSKQILLLALEQEFKLKPKPKQ